MFMDPLIEAATTYPRPLVNIRDIQTIFAFIPELISLSSTLVNRLKDAICTTDSGETQTQGSSSYLGKVFCELEDEFDVYISYAANFSKQQRCILRADRSIVYRQLVQVKRKDLFPIFFSLIVTQQTPFTLLGLVAQEGNK